MNVNEERRGEEDGKSINRPNYGTTGLLATDEAFQKQGTILKYREPVEGRSPDSAWTLLAFEVNGDDVVHSTPLRKSSTLLGRDNEVADILVDDKSSSKQHAVIQFRQNVKKNEFGDVSVKILPYVIDLDSANGTTLNGKKIGGSRFVELRNSDILRFGYAPLEYVLMLSD